MTVIFFPCYVSMWLVFFFFFFNDTATTEIYTLSLHDALPIWRRAERSAPSKSCARMARLKRTFCSRISACRSDRKSTRLNSSHSQISYAVFCLKKKKKKKKIINLEPLQAVQQRPVDMTN